jgi:hypothetical protein
MVVQFMQIRPGILALEHAQSHGVPYMHSVYARREKNAR